MRTVKRLVAAGVVVATLGSAAPAFAHAGGHRGGCEEFGHINLYYSRLIRETPGGYKSLGDAISDFARDPDGRGVGDVVETQDHPLCQ